LHKRFSKNKTTKIISIVVIILVVSLIVIFDRQILRYTLGFPIKGIFTLIGKAPGMLGKVMKDYGSLFWNGIEVTIHLSLVGTVIGFIIALFVSFLITQKIEVTDNKFSVVFKKITIGISKIYVTVIRSTPMLCQAMIFYYAIPLFHSGLLGFISQSDKILLAGLFTVSVNTGAYLTEVLRGSIKSIDIGQYEAGRSLGLTRFKTMMNIMYPQAIKNSMPSIGNEFIINIKDTSVLSIIMCVDVFRVAQLAAGKFASNDIPFLIASAIYLCLTLSINFILTRVERRLGVQTKVIPSSN
jgi:putative lysine transport system permease protein